MNQFKMSLFLPPISPVKDSATGRTVNNQYRGKLIRDLHGRISQLGLIQPARAGEADYHRPEGRIL